MRAIPLSPLSLGLLALALPVITASPAAADPAFGPARNSVEFKLGGFFPAGESDLWELNEDEFTTSADDFNDFAFAVAFNKQLNNYAALSTELMFYEGEDSSIDRRFGDLRQHSALRLLPATLSLRWQPFGKYESGGAGYPGRPQTLVPYVSIGGGVLLWEYELEGEFEDPFDPDFFFVDRYSSDGITPVVIAAAGIEIAMNGAWSVIVEGRYLWAHDDLDEEDFLGFDAFDLSGASIFVGASIRF